MTITYRQLIELDYAFILQISAFEFHIRVKRESANHKENEQTQASMIMINKLGEHIFFVISAFSLNAYLAFKNGNFLGWRICLVVFLVCGY